MDRLFDDADDALSVRELSRRIRDALAEAFPRRLWVWGEVSQLRRDRAGHLWLRLSEPGRGGREAASVGAVVWASQVRQITGRLARAGVGPLTEGLRVRVRVEVSWYVPRGTLSLVVVAIDPAFTAGALAAERERVLRVLAAEDLLDRQRDLPMPALPLTVGLVTAAGSAAERDFLDELEASGFGFRVLVADAVVQGPRAERSVVAALSRLARRGCDVICVVRGGGSRSDLAAFDSERIARAVATCEVPVLTGIGHEIDEAVCDRVAHRALKTPTACAGHLVALVSAQADRLAVAAARTAEVARRGLTAAEGSLGRHHRHLLTAARAAERQATRRIIDDAGRLERAAVRAVAVAGTHLEDTRDRAARAAVRALRAVIAPVDSSADRLVRLGPRRVEVAAGHLRSREDRLVRVCTRAVATADRHLQAAAARARAGDPAQLLARGWSITRTADGNLVRSVADVTAGEAIRTRVADGVIGSVVSGPSPDGDGAGSTRAVSGVDRGA